MVDSESGKIGTFGHGYTYGGHPVAARWRSRPSRSIKERDIVGHVRQVAPAFPGAFDEAVEHPLVGEALGVGLIGGIELVADKKTKANFRSRQGGRRDVSATFCEEEGLIVRAAAGRPHRRSARR